MSRTEPLSDANITPRYRKVKNLNRGAFGTVQLALDLWAGENVAIKFMERGPGMTKYVERELVQHRMLVHPHVIQFKEAFLTPYHLGVVLEYADGGDMFRYVAKRKRLTENCARWIFQQLLLAVDYCHRLGVANRDIKLENVLVSGHPDRPFVKLCDLGFAKHVGMHSAPDSLVGTPQYVAPEIVAPCDEVTPYDGRVADIWSCGVMLYVMLVGGYPFERPGDALLRPANRHAEMIKRILRADYHVPNIGLSPECVDLLKRMLTVDPARRITVPEIQTHGWYQAYLPAGVLELNEELLQKPRESGQTREEVVQLVAEARKLGVGAVGAPSNLSPAEYEAMVDQEVGEAAHHDGSHILAG